MPTHETTMSGHEARSAKTRAQLIDAAIEVIAAVGYEGASTRALTKAANATLSSIPYHFGSKKELYFAAAKMIAEYAAKRFEEAIAILNCDAEPDMSLRFERALIRVLHILLVEAEPYSWAAFVTRCSYDNDEAYALIHEHAIAPLLERLIHAASESSGRSTDDAVLRLRVNAILTAIFSFRFLRGIMLRGMEWTSLQNEAIKQMTNMIHDLCHSGFINVQPKADLHR